jgi:hypothetical protein
MPKAASFRGRGRGSGERLPPAAKQMPALHVDCTVAGACCLLLKYEWPSPPGLAQPLARGNDCAQEGT